MKIVPRRWNWDGRVSLDEEGSDTSREGPLVWLAPCIDDPDLQRHLLGLLSPDESSRHERLRRQEDRRRFLTGRGLLRLVAGEHLNIPPGNVTFAYGHFGKPSLARTHGGPPLHFNISHSGELVLLAFSIRHQVGVDLEQFRPETEWREVAAELFSAGQHAEWQRLPEAERADFFFRTWTRKEAALKAIGWGLAENQISHFPQPPRLYDLDLPSGYAGAIAILDPELAPAGGGSRPPLS